MNVYNRKTNRHIYNDTHSLYEHTSRDIWVTATKNPPPPLRGPHLNLHDTWTIPKFIINLSVGRSLKKGVNVKRKQMLQYLFRDYFMNFLDWNDSSETIF